MLDALRQAARALKSQPGFAAIVVVVLGLGIGANGALFSAVNSLLLRPLPYANPSQLVEVSLPRRGPTVADLKNSRSFAAVGAYRIQVFDVLSRGAVTRTIGFSVTPNFFSVLGVEAAIGRVFTPDEHERTVVISYPYWREISGDPHIIGQTLSISGEPRTVVGVLPADFTLSIRDAMVFLPAPDNQRGNGGIVARLNDGVTAASAQAEITGISRALGAEMSAGSERATVIPLAQALRSNDANVLLLLQASLGLVLLITCANVGNLLIVRAIARRREFAIRLALGAGRGRLFSQLMTESAVLAVLGGLLGSLLASWSLGIVDAELPANLERRLRGAEGLSIDATVLAFLAALSMSTVVLFGLAPALQVYRADLMSTLREARATSPRRQRLGRGLVVAEVSLALMLSIGAGLTAKDLFGLQRADLGFSADNVLRAAVDLPAARYPTGERRAAVVAAMAERCRALPGVELVGVIAPQYFPFGGPRVRGSLFALRTAPGVQARAEVYVANADYFRAVRIPLLKGRLFGDADTSTSPPVALIGASVASRYWGTRNPIGDEIRLQAEEPRSSWATVVGVVGDVRNPVATDVQPTAYRPYSQSLEASPILMIRTNRPATTLVEPVRQAMHAIDRDGPEPRVVSLQAALWDYLSYQRFSTSAIAIFAALGLLLTAVGVYGVMRNWVTLRTHEIGVRIALGARPRDVLRLVVGSAAATVFAGVAIGVAGALALQRVIASWLYGVSAVDPFVFAIVIAMMSAVAFGAAFLPARRAATVDPVLALRVEA